MKQTLLSIGLLISIGCLGQTTGVGGDSLTRYATSFLTPHTWSDSFKTTWCCHETSDGKTDTTQVILLVCDTAIKSGFGFGIYDTVTKKIETGTQWYYSESVWWMKGYEVVELLYGQVPCRDYGTSAVAVICYGWIKNKTLYYLDEDKKPLSKSLLIWLTK